MINQILELVAELDGLIAAFITGIFTFFITKYNYHKNIPLDKYEIAYNRVYYPLYRLVTSDKSVADIINITDLYFEKYMKYVDRSSLVAFRNLKRSTTLEKRENTYINFKNNIYGINSKLRRRLGYLEPDVFSVYKYLSPSDKRFIRIFLELAGVYLSIFLYSILKFTSFQNVSIIIFCIVIFAFCIDVIGAIIQKIINEIKKLTVK